MADTRVVYRSNVNPDDWVIARGSEQIKLFKDLGWTPIKEREFNNTGYPLETSNGSP